MVVVGKAEETFGPQAGEWCRPSTPGRVERLDYLCSTLGIATDNGRYVPLAPGRKIEVF